MLKEWDFAISYVAVFAIYNCVNKLISEIKI